MIPLELSLSTEESLILTLLDLANHLAKNGEAMAAQEGLTSQQWLVLLQVAGDPNFPSPRRGAQRQRAREHGADGVLASDIAAARGVSRANVSSMVSPLLRRKLVQQTDDTADRRRKLLTLTPTGREVIERLEPLRRRANQKLFADLDPAAKKALLRHLRHRLTKLSRGLSKTRQSHAGKGIVRGT